MIHGVHWQAVDEDLHNGGFVVQPLKWHGGKHYLSRKIVALMPPRCANPNAPATDDPGWLHYVEPYFGGGSVMLENDPEGISEVVNDLNSTLTWFWRVLQDYQYFYLFKNRVEAMPCSQKEFDDAARRLRGVMHDQSWWERAVDFFIVNRQSRQALGKDFATLARTRTRRGMNELPSAWLSAVEGLPEIHARLQRVVILNKEAVQVIKEQDGPRTLFYLDPPYLHETRATTGEYEHEMTTAQHFELLQALDKVKGRFMLSGYPSNLYDRHAKIAGWKCHEFKINNHAAGGKTKRVMTEVLWCNF